MGIYKKALVKYINHLEEEEGRHLFWKFFEELFDRSDKEKCAELVIYLADVIEDEN